MLGIDYSILHFLEPTSTNRFMAEGEGSDDYTKVTITTIVFVSIIIMVYFFLTDIGQRVSEKSGSFTNSSELALLYRMVYARILCLCDNLHVPLWACEYACCLARRQ